MNSLKIKSKKKKESVVKRLQRDMRKNLDLYLLVLPVVIYYIIFIFGPMYGAIIAFKDFSPAKGILGSNWVGFKHFTNFFSSPNFKVVMYNTLNISLKSILFGFPVPIIFALLLNEIKNKKFSSVIKTVSYFPHFVSLVVICAMIKTFVSNNGLIGEFINSFTGGKTSLLNDSKYFVSILVTSDIWQQFGWNSIIYLAAIAGIDQQLYEAAQIDGAGRFKQLLHVTLPGILPTVMLLLIMRMGSVMTVGYEKILLLSNDMILDKAEVISTYVYRLGLQNFQYSFSTAVGLFNSAINILFVLTANKISKKLTDVGLI